jgi:hypothetical protein
MNQQFSLSQIIQYGYQKTKTFMLIDFKFLEVV